MLCIDLIAPPPLPNLRKSGYTYIEATYVGVCLYSQFFHLKHRCHTHCLDIFGPIDLHMAMDNVLCIICHFLVVDVASPNNLYVLSSLKAPASPGNIEGCLSLVLSVLLLPTNTAYCHEVVFWRTLRVIIKKVRRRCLICQPVTHSWRASVRVGKL